MWNLEQQHFEVGAHILTVEVEDIYFLIGLLRRDAPISLTGSRRGDITTQELIDRHCNPWDKDIREENPHKSSDGWTSTDYIVYHAESGRNPRSAQGF